MGATNYTSDHAARLIEAIRCAISVRPMTADELTECVPMARKTMEDYLRHMHRNGLCHIARWAQYDRTGEGLRSNFHPCYAAGAGVDVTKPRVSAAERCKQYRKRILADPEAADVYHARARARHYKLVRDPLIEALFGKAI